MILGELHLILASNDGYKKVFLDLPMTSFKNDNHLQTHLVRSQLPDSNEVGRCKACTGKNPPCQL